MNVGDKVRIDLSEVRVNEYYKDIYYNEDMMKYNGSETIIKEKIDERKFRLEVDNGEWNWGIDVLKKKRRSSKQNNSDSIDNTEIIEKFTQSFEKLGENNSKSIETLIGGLENINNNINNLVKNINNRTLYDDSMQEAVIRKVQNISTEELLENIEKKLDSYIKKTYGQLPKMKIEINNGECVRDIKGMFHNKFEQILKMVKAGVPVMLTGPAGAGKNHTLEQVAEALGLDFYFSNAITQEFTLKGFIDAGGNYHETQFYKAYKDGGIFFLDEVDGSIAEALLTLNSAIANGYYDFPIGRVNAHKDFRVVCAGNTYGTGADMIYVGRNVLDGATLDRFAVIDFDYDKDIEEQLSYDKDLYDFIVALRKTVNDNQLRYIISMRATINSTKLLDMGLNKKDVLISTIIKSMKTDDLNIIVENINCKNEWFDLLKEVVNERN